MKVVFLGIFAFLCFSVAAQSPRMARSYYNAGEYQKATELYKQLHEKHAYRTDYFKFLISCYQQTSKYSDAKQVILDQLKKYPKKLQFYVELGYNYDLQNQKDSAKINYQKAVDAVNANPQLGYNTGLAFQNNNLLDYALQVYKSAMAKDSSLNFNLQIALIYGEQGNLNNMFDTLLNIVDKDSTLTLSILRYVGSFISDNASDANNILLKNLLIKRLQTNPNVSWNMLLSWLYMQEKQYSKALIQEKAIFKRNAEDFSRLITLGDITFKAEDYNVSSQCFDFIIKNTMQKDVLIKAHLYLINIDIATKTSPKDLVAIDKSFNKLLTDYGFNTSTLEIQQAYASFLGFNLNKPQEAIALFKKSLDLNLDAEDKGALKLKLADMYVYDNQLNQALVAYTQVKLNFKNSILAQMATFKIAQTSYYKGDFDWAQTQLNVIKSETSQLISNDAFELNLLIETNTQTDSTVALKRYAKAELLAYQNKTQMAVDSLSFIITKFKGLPIESYAYFKQAQLFEKLKLYQRAADDYLKIIASDKSGVLADDACYHLAKLYQNKMKQTDLAAKYYEKIIFDYPASIYLVASRTEFRQLKPNPIN